MDAERTKRRIKPFDRTRSFARPKAAREPAQIENSVLREATAALLAMIRKKELLVKTAV
jgi:hypothetical protein